MSWLIPGAARYLQVGLALFSMTVEANGAERWTRTRGGTRPGSPAR